MVQTEDELAQYLADTLDPADLTTIVEYGSGIGVPGFTYTREIDAFYRDHQAACWDALWSATSRLDMSVGELLDRYLSTFNDTALTMIADAVVNCALESCADAALAIQQEQMVVIADEEN